MTPAMVAAIRRLCERPMNTWIAFLIILAIGGFGAYCIAQTFFDVAYANASIHWPATHGTIQHSELKIRAGRVIREWIVVPTYTYQVDGKTYSSSRTCFVHAAAFRADTFQDAERLLLHYQAGRSVSVRFAPTRPSLCTLQTGMDLAGTINCVMVTIVGALILCVALIFCGVMP